MFDILRKFAKQCFIGDSERNITCVELYDKNIKLCHENDQLHLDILQLKNTIDSLIYIDDKYKEAIAENTRLNNKYNITMQKINDLRI
jgi:hypothetical protein